MLMATTMARRRNSATPSFVAGFVQERKAAEVAEAAEKAALLAAGQERRALAAEREKKRTERQKAQDAEVARRRRELDRLKNNSTRKLNAGSPVR